MIEVMQFIKWGCRKIGKFFLAKGGAIRHGLALFREDLRTSTLSAISGWIVLTMLGCAVICMVTFLSLAIFAHQPTEHVDAMFPYIIGPFIAISVLVLIIQSIGAAYDQFKYEREHFVTLLKKDYK